MTKTKLYLSCFCLLLPIWAGEDIIIQDFEGDKYGEWTAKGDAFGSSPAKGNIGSQQGVLGFKGKGLVNTYQNRDLSTGTLTSPLFEIKRKYITFLIGGGSSPKTALQLLIDDKVVLSRSGSQSEWLTPAIMDVSKLLGQKAQLRIV
ncbi:MAG: hypothetical protein HQL32_04495, partial [Planctomycetes bacterium]|nr:hypothetical protein [Planctomycetota bacterium]